MTTNNNDDQTLAQFLEPEPEQNTNKPEVNFVPLVDAGTANNGILKIVVTNIEELWALELFENPYQPCFKVTCKWVTGQQRPAQLLSHEKVIMVGNIATDGSLYLSLDPQLDAYDFIFSLQTRNMHKNQWMPPSQVCTVKVPSFSLDLNFSEKEYVDFRNYNDYQPIPAQIVEVLENDMFKLEYEEYDSAKADYVEKTVTVDVSRLYKQEIDHQYLTRIHSQQQMEKDLYLQRSDTESYAVWHVLDKCLSTICVEICYDFYQPEELLMHYAPMSVLVARHVLQYLFEPQFEYKVNCFINDSHGGLQLINVRRKYLEIHRNVAALHDAEESSSESDAIGEIIDGFDTARVCCDWCWITMGEYEYYYTDADVCMAEGHDVCVSCVATVIRLNGELKNILQEILQPELIMDCIDVIADFVIGSVKVIDLTEKKSSKKKTTNGVKRKTEIDGDDDETVACKKRKYDPLLI